MINGYGSFMVIQVIICICVLALFLSILIDFSVYSRKDGVQKERRSVVETGTMTMFFIAFYFILHSGIGVVAVSSTAVKACAAVAGTLLIAAGCTANIYGRFNLGRNWANQIKIYKEQTLVSSGMYKLVRHPLYSSIMLMFLGACLVYRNIATLAAVVLIFIPFMWYRARQEEVLLLQRFEEYKEYRYNTGMFFPRLHRKQG